MSENDHGHINNLDKTQKIALKECWIDLISKISTETSLPDKHIVKSDYGYELFTWFGYENPDVLLLRWLRANKWDVEVTVQQIMNLLKWRMKWGVQEFLAKGESEISLQEAAMGKGYVMGRDKAGRPVCYIHAKEHIRGQFPVETTEKLAVLALETCQKLLQSPIETFTVVIDVSGLSTKNVDLHLANLFINLFQNTYPEALGLGFIINGSWFFNRLWAIVKPWLDPAVESKIKFLKKETDLTTYIDPSDIPQRLHGKHQDFKYILPTDEDQAMLDAFRNDHQGKTIAQTNYRQAATRYLKTTLRWANSEDNQNLISVRTKACTKRTDAYEKLVPYISTRIHYHRTGDINEPIFDITYNKLCSTEDDVVYF